MNEFRYRRICVWTVLCSGVVCLLAFFWSGRMDATAEWRLIQEDFIGRLSGTDESGQPGTPENPVEIRQIELAEFGVVDRCVSCHVDLEHPEGGDRPLPFRSHSGQWLKHHPPQRFGCTICHGGYGRLLNSRQLCVYSGPGSDVRAVLPVELTTVRCGGCHLSVYYEPVSLREAGGVYRGWQAFKRRGCQACHQVRGTGGLIGPDLSAEGGKTSAEFDFQYVPGAYSPANWHRQHLRQPQKVSPGSRMLAYELDPVELEDLVLFVLGLYRPVFPAQYLDLNLINELKKARRTLTGEEIYLRFCSACHGPEGKGGENVVLGVRFPMLSNPDFQAVASRKFLEYTIRHGRETRMMTSWQTGYGGLDEREVREITGGIRQYRPEPADLKAVLDLKGSQKNGEIVYASFCACCHGAGGEGGLGPSLNNPDFLKLADRRYLFSTIVTGRSDTAMPAWARLAARELADLLACVESWRTGSQNILTASSSEGDAGKGAALFSQYCSRCHGDKGQGGVAPAILNPDFLKVAGESFILGNMSSGRNHTGMLGWRSEQKNDGKLTPAELGDLLAYFRSNPQEEEPGVIHQQSLGDARSGGRVYMANCAECHGPEGRGGLGPALINQFFLKGATNGYLTATVVLGRAGTPMPSWAREGRDGRVRTSRQIQDVVSYLRSWHRREIKWDVPLDNGEKDPPESGN